jgi:hypothetical protein
MNLRKVTLLAAGLLFLFFIFPAASKAVVAIPSIDFYLTESNVFPDGYDNYGKIELTEEDCNGYMGVAIKVTPNHDFFIAGNNFGIQAFSLNVKGNPDTITFTLPDGWIDIKLQGKSRSEFGVFIVDFDGKGYSRRDPLEIKACSDAGNLAIDDFVIPNEQGYLFAAHIAGFYLGGEPGLYSFQIDEDADDLSAWFATKGKPTFAEEISFTASAGDGATTLQWTAVSEENVLGYNIYRARGIFGKFEKINEHLVYATGSVATTAEYEYIDSNLQTGLYAYKLFEIGTDGLTKAYGPVRLFVK